MDIASNIPFDLRLIHKFPKEIEEQAVDFASTEEEIWNTDRATLTAEENDEIGIY